MKKAIKKIVALIGIGLSLLALLSVLFILVKDWGLRTPLTDEWAKVSERFQEMKNRLQKFRGTVQEMKAGVVQAQVEAFSNRIKWFRAPLTRIQKTLENTENQLAARRQALMELEGNLLFKIDFGILALSLLCPILMAGQASLLYLLWGWFRRKEQPVS
jgi:uncharacterized protein YukE